MVIGIIAILAGVALGPITNGLQQARHDVAMQQGRQIGLMCFAYSTDNTANGNAYPSDLTGANIASDLLNTKYCNDPSVFLVAGQNGTAVYTMPAAGTAASLASSNCSWSFTCINPQDGITPATPDLTPLVYFNNGPGVGIVSTIQPSGGVSAIALGSACPFGTDGIAVFYKGNNAVYIKAISGTVAAGSFVSPNDKDTTTYLVAP